MNNNIIKIQEMLLDEMEIIQKMNIKEGLFKREIERSKVLSCSAVNYLKAVNTNIKIKEYADSKNKTIEELNKELGIDGNK